MKEERVIRKGSALLQDESLPAKLLLNLVDCTRQRSAAESSEDCDSLKTTWRVFTLKFDTIAEMQSSVHHGPQHTLIADRLSAM